MRIWDERELDITEEKVSRQIEGLNDLMAEVFSYVRELHEELESKDEEIEDLENNIDSLNDKIEELELNELEG